MTKIWIGIDGGASRSQAILTDDSGELLRTVQGAALNPLTVGWKHFEDNFQHLLIELQRTSSRIPDALCAGLAGVGREAARRQAEEILRKTSGVKAVTVITDAEAALWGAFRGGPGLLLIAGTGSICLGMDANGNRARSGGFGYLLGDEGGGYWIAAEALRVALKSVDRRASTNRLPEFICEVFNVEDIRDLIPLVHSGEVSPRQLASSAEKILSFAAREPAAADIISRAAAHLAELIAVTAKKLDLHQPRVALSGGLWKSAGLEMQKALHEALRHLKLSYKIVPVQDPPEWGAIHYLQKTTPPA